jgi:hypothetical protein
MRERVVVLNDFIYQIRRSMDENGSDNTFFIFTFIFFVTCGAGQILHRCG